MVIEKVKRDDGGGWGQGEIALGEVLEVILRGSLPWEI